VVAAQVVGHLPVRGVQLRVVVLVRAGRGRVGEVSVRRGRHERRPNRQRARDRYENPAQPLTSVRMLTAGGRRSRRSALGRAQAVAVYAVVRSVRAHVCGEREVPARLGAVARLLQRAAEAEVREVVHRGALHDGGELVARLRVAARAEVRAAQRLADRRLVGLEPARAFERDRGRREVAGLEQVGAAAEQVVDVLAALLRAGPVIAHAGPAPPACTCSARSRSIASRIAAATSSFDARGTCCSPPAVMIVTSFSGTSKPISARETSFTTTASRPFPSSLARARSTAPAPVSTAKRTGSIGSRVPPAVTSSLSPSSERGANGPARSASSIAARISGGSARRPAPHSPREASAPVPGGRIVAPRARSVSTFARVAGW